MATKKQKHAEAVARREVYLAKEKAIGEKAIEVAARKREARIREAWATGHKKHFKFVDECPHCTTIKEEQARKKAAEAVERVAAAAKKLLEAQIPEGRKLLEAPIEDESIDLTRAS